MLRTVVSGASAPPFPRHASPWMRQKGLSIQFILTKRSKAQMGLWLNDQQNIMKLSFYQVALISVWLQHQGSNPTGFCTAPLKHHNCHKKTCTKKLMKYRDKSTCYLKKKWCFGFLHQACIEHFKTGSKKRQVNCVYVLFYSCWNVPTSMLYPRRNYIPV